MSYVSHRPWTDPSSLLIDCLTPILSRTAMILPYKLALLLSLVTAAVVTAEPTRSSRRHVPSPHTRRSLQKAEKLPKDATNMPSLVPSTAPSAMPVSVAPPSATVAACVETARADPMRFMVTADESVIVRYRYELAVGVPAETSATTLQNSSSNQLPLATQLVAAMDAVDALVQTYLMDELVLNGTCTSSTTTTNSNGSNDSRRRLAQAVSVTTGEPDVVLGEDDAVCETLLAAAVDEGTVECFAVQGSFQVFISKTGGTMDALAIKDQALQFLESAVFGGTGLLAATVATIEFIVGVHYTGQAPLAVEVVVVAPPGGVDDETITANTTAITDTQQVVQDDSTNVVSNVPTEDLTDNDTFWTATVCTCVAIGVALGLVSVAYLGKVYNRRVRLMGRGVDKNFDDDNSVDLPVRINETMESGSSANEPGTEIFLDDLEAYKTFDNPARSLSSASADFEGDTEILNLGMVAMTSAAAMRSGRLIS